MSHTLLALFFSARFLSFVFLLVAFVVRHSIASFGIVHNVLMIKRERAITSRASVREPRASIPFALRLASYRLVFFLSSSIQFASSLHQREKIALHFYSQRKCASGECMRRTNATPRLVSRPSLSQRYATENQPDDCIKEKQKLFKSNCFHK